MDATTHDLLLRGVRVRFQDEGRGPAVLLVHGFLVSHSAWTALLPLLTPRFRVIAPDLPGFGDSEKPARYSYSREAYADTLCDLLAGLGIPRASVVGHGMGGGVALTMAAAHPEHVERLVAMDAAAFPSGLGLRQRLPRLPWVGPLLFKQLYGRLLFHRQFRDEFYLPGYPYDRARVDAWFEAFDPPEARESAYKALLALGDTAALTPRLPRVRAPSLVLWGERDRRYPVELGERLARELPDARLEVIAGAGHCPADDHPDETAAHLERFLLG
ncbi:MAG: alpha/beta hydrolase [Deltaproteobacteria bacterium]|nr:alpha/beta hydrolase [Deltaproteobacteria bacterium]